MFRPIINCVVIYLPELPMMSLTIVYDITPVCGYIFTRASHDIIDYCL